MSNRLWPVHYWQAKKKRILAAITAFERRRDVTATGLVLIALIFTVAVVSGIQLSNGQSEKEQTGLPAQQGAVQSGVAVTKNEALSSHSVTGLIPGQEPADLLAAKPPPAASVEKPASKASSVPEKGICPVKGSPGLDYGWQYHSAFKDWRYHPGVDILTQGKEPVKAAFNGTVETISDDPRTGLTVVVKSGPYQVLYGSLSEAFVKQGQKLTAGQAVGLTGECFTEPGNHLHIGIKENGEYLNPREVIGN
ncbi:M23 family metallopeptidase [Acetonema longum]|uniref:Peptidase M23 n=1 Tax=Acetonema longum DSM 6540 TaxID=1009370 RepID=F7NIU6_9FIRM|nr:M23 family metallopeptidase [Acetonema longum]EGO64069.1 peptidase M23 [Acetonema longum DSM 6540]